MSRLLPFPCVSAGLLMLWLLLNQPLSIGQLLVGFAVALVGGWTLTSLQPPKTWVGRPAAMLRLTGVVISEVIRSNFAVASIILGLSRREWNSGFVAIPLELRNPYALGVLACIITATPGTVWVDFEAASGKLTLHVLDLIDEEDWVRTIKGRYEQPLMEIFV